MSLEAILNHILEEAKEEKEKIIQKAKEEKEKIIQAAKAKAERLYQEILEKEKAENERQRQKRLVNARLEAKINLLRTKQELIDAVFKELKSHLSQDKLKKQQISQDKVQDIPEDMDFYLSKIRQDYETEIAKILFETSEKVS